MSLPKDQIRQEVMKLDPLERDLLITELAREIEPKRAEEIDAAWLAEVERRDAEFEAGIVMGIPVEEVLAELYAKARK